ncbi:MAG: HEAT repeat domain-containing protein [Candidatus Omnitrophica bacterium]|nr:HEAT repeat domain-containing protein [Candidatus Omnitrophota bacterium]
MAQAYMDKNKVKGVGFASGLGKNEIYDQYLQSARQGVFNFIKEETDPLEGDVVLRKYFSGGIVGSSPIQILPGASSPMDPTIQGPMMQFAVEMLPVGHTAALPDQVVVASSYAPNAEGTGAVNVAADKFDTAGVAALLRSREADTRLQGVDAVRSGANKEQVVDLLSKVIADPNPVVRRRAFIVLGKKADERAIPLLLEELKALNERKYFDPEEERPSIEAALENILVRKGYEFINATWTQSKEIWGDAESVIVRAMARIVPDSPQAKQFIYDLWSKNLNSLEETELALARYGEKEWLPGILHRVSDINKYYVGRDSRHDFLLAIGRRNPGLLATELSHGAGRRSYYITLIGVLGEVHASQAVNELQSVIKDSTIEGTETQLAAIRAFGLIAGGAAFDLLAELSQQKQMTVEKRIAVIEALGHTDDPRAGEIIAHLFITAGYPKVGLAAVGALGKLRNLVDAEILLRISQGSIGYDHMLLEPVVENAARAELNAWIEDEAKAQEGAERRQASSAVAFDEIGTLLYEYRGGRTPVAKLQLIGKLSASKDPRAVSKLIELLSDNYELARIFASKALGRIGDPRAMKPLMAAKLNADALSAPHISEALTTVLAKMPFEDFMRELNELDQSRTTQTSDKDATPDFLRALGRTHDSRAVKILTTRLDYYKYPSNIVRAAIEALGEFGTDECIDILFKQFRYQNRYYWPKSMQEEASRRVEYVSGYSAESMEHYVLKYENPFYDSLVEAFVRIGKRALPKLISLFLSSLGSGDSPEVAIAQALGIIGDSRAVGPLIDYFKRPEGGWVKKTAVLQALGRLGGDEAVKFLMELPEDDYKEWEVYIEALGRSKNPKAIEMIQGCFVAGSAPNDSHEHLMETAAIALSNFGAPETMEEAVLAYHHMMILDWRGKATIIAKQTMNQWLTSASLADGERVGGISFKELESGMEIKVDDKGMPLPPSRQSWDMNTIQGFIPVLDPVAVPVNLPGLLGRNDPVNGAPVSKSFYLGKNNLPMGKELENAGA